jgi:hypothetical protein
VVDLPGVFKASEMLPFKSAEGDGGTTDGERLLNPLDFVTPLALTKLLWKTFELGSIVPSLVFSHAQKTRSCEIVGFPLDGVGSLK